MLKGAFSLLILQDNPGYGTLDLQTFLTRHFICSINTVSKQRLLQLKNACCQAQKSYSIAIKTNAKKGSLFEVNEISDTAQVIRGSYFLKSHTFLLYANQTGSHFPSVYFYPLLYSSFPPIVYPLLGF